MSCMIFLPSFYKPDDFTEGNEKFKLAGEDLEKLNKFLKNFKLLTSQKLLLFKIFTTPNILQVLTF